MPLLALALVACVVGDIGDRTAGGKGPGSGSTGGTHPTGPTGSTVLRHLNRVELANTFADLLGDAYAGDPDAVVNGLAPDPRVDGFDTIGDALTTSAGFVQQAHGLVDAIVADTNLATLHACASPGSGCLNEFLDDVGLRALRRPPTTEERQSYTTLFQTVQAKKGDDAALGAVLTRLLTSPDFLYHVALGDSDSGKLSGFELASRLSYLLWETMPDAELFSVAAKGELVTPEQVEAQVARMLADPRAKRTMSRFLALWFDIDKLDAVVKDPAIYPDFEALSASMRGEFDHYVDHVVFEGDGDVKTLLTSQDTFVDGPLATFYGLPAPKGTGFELAQADATKRSGLLSQAAFLAIQGKGNRSAPILRGVFVRNRLLCAPMPPPPPNASAIPPDLPSPTTTRDFFANLTSPSTCAQCHMQINPIGFGFEHFDGMGRYRDDENGYPIDASGDLTAGDQAGPFDGAVELAAKLAASEDVERCIAREWFRFRFGRVGSDGDSSILDALYADFTAAGGKFSALATSLARSEALYDPHLHLEGTP